ncbi:MULTISPECIES: hypothetical protein [unclassified Streptomyces]|uniref:hypothetical protein n=1 Tax=unclassified Streptomyces TaxID=2593676 RepID=UPI002E771434|nr:hypothetical protein [Streptomyces sp. JV190]MEE1839889.1 hypothetical protein [Streptomyces sp. JV190]
MPDGEKRKRDAPDAPLPGDASAPEDAQAQQDPQDPQAQQGPQDPELTDAARRRRRAQFLRELHEAKALRDRVQPRRARAARMRQAMRMRTFRW